MRHPVSSVDTQIKSIVSGITNGGVCTTELAEGPWVFDAQPLNSYGPGSSMGDVIPTGSPRQG